MRETEGKRNEVKRRNRKKPRNVKTSVRKRGRDGGKELKIKRDGKIVKRQKGKYRSDSCVCLN